MASASKPAAAKASASAAPQVHQTQQDLTHSIVTSTNIIVHHSEGAPASAHIQVAEPKIPPRFLSRDASVPSKLARKRKLATEKPQPDSISSAEDEESDEELVEVAPTTGGPSKNGTTAAPYHDSLENILILRVNPWFTPRLTVAETSIKKPRASKTTSGPEPCKVSAFERAKDPVFAKEGLVVNLNNKKFLFCNPCRKPFNTTKYSTLKTHISSGGHSAALQRSQDKAAEAVQFESFLKNQQSLADSSRRLEMSVQLYRFQTCRTLLSTGIPFNKIDAHSDFCQLIERDRRSLPNWSALVFDFIALYMPSSAPVERVFSMLEHLFTDEQSRALEDYRTAALLIHYNDLQRKTLNELRRRAAGGGEDVEVQLVD